MLSSSANELPVVTPVFGNRLRIAAQVGAAALIGFGLILWIAANWAEFGKWARFAIVGGTLAVSALAAITTHSARIPGSLIALCATGGLLALHGQTYQTGADPWTLFAIWSLLALPWAIAARHDAVWGAWIVVAFTALGLWVASSSGRWAQVPLADAATAWLIGGALAFAMSPSARLERVIGRARWAFRLAVVSLAMLVVVYAVPAVFGDRAGVYLLGLAVIAAGAIALAIARPLDLPLLAVATLALDTLLIVGLWRVIVTGLRTEYAPNILLAGLLAAGVVAASAIALLRIARSAAASGVDAQGTADRIASSRWPIAVLTGAGALLAAVPIWIFYGMTFTMLLRSAGGAFFLGVVTIAGALALLHRADSLGFRAQFGFIALLTGIGVAGYGCYDGLSASVASLAMAAIVTILAFVIEASWIRALLGAAAAGFVGATLVAIGGDRAMRLLELRFAAPTWIAIAGAVGLAAWHRMDDGKPRAALAPFLLGWVAAAIGGLILASGSTFLFGAGMLPTHSATTGGSAQWMGFSLRKGLSLACAAVAFALAFSARREFRTPLGYGVAVAAVVLAWLAGSLGPILLLGAVSYGMRLRALAVFAAVGAVWCIGALYYQLDLTLATKALVLVALGTAIGVLTMLYRSMAPLRVTATPHGWRPGVAATLIGLGLVATAGTVGTSILEKESIIRDGRRVYVRLAPVDPRSLMQGDYMALRFELPDRGRASREQTRMQAVATHDARGIATISRIVRAPATLSGEEFAIDLKLKNGAWMIATDAWYFREGTAKRFEAARYGEFRLLGDGRVLLVGMADEKLEPIK